MAYGTTDKELSKATRNREMKMSVEGRKVAYTLVTGKRKNITCSGDSSLKDADKRKASMEKEKEDMRRFIKKTYPMVEVKTQWEPTLNVYVVKLADGSKLFIDPNAKAEKVEAKVEVMPEVTA
jgi:hypothetical protein